MWSRKPADVGKYFPTIYSGVRETDELALAENPLFDKAIFELDRLWANKFIKSAEVVGIEDFEKILGILANPELEDLEFRRARVLHRWSLTSPFTMPYLRMKLDELLGVGNWSYELHFNEYELVIEAPAIDPAWGHEISVMVTAIKPANIIFVSRPAVAKDVLVSERISMRKNLFHWNYPLNSTWQLGRLPFATNDTRILNAVLDGSYILDGTPLVEVLGSVHWNYPLNGTWKLGRLPFVIRTDEEVIKDWSESSIMAELLIDLAKETSSLIKKVRINGTYEAQNFVMHASSGNIAYLEYFVPMAAFNGPITLIELLDENDVVLTKAIVYVDTTFDVYFKHKIQHKEGF